MALRRADLKPPSQLSVFYHVSCMGNWQQVVEEQLRLMAHVGLRGATACVLGTIADATWLTAFARTFDVSIFVRYVNDDLSLYEGPTLCKLHKFAQENQDRAVLYFHTKGVSAQGCPIKRQWRRVMAKHVIADWRKNLELLAVADMCGVSWQELPDFPHFCGNFWMARCDWIASLQSPEEYRRRHGPDMRWAGHSWRDRMYVETWLGSEGWHHVESFCCRNGFLWEGPQIFTFPFEVEGFSYGS
jgi:hypothetical protein